MRFYHPCAVYIDNDGKGKCLFTYDSCTTMEEAEKQIKFWEEVCDYQIIVAYVQIYNERGKKIGIHELTNSGNPEEQYRMAMWN